MSEEIDKVKLLEEHTSIKHASVEEESLASLQREIVELRFPSLLLHGVDWPVEVAADHNYLLQAPVV